MNLTLSQAKASPCSQCVSAQCCQLLILETYPLRTLNDVDKTAFYLNFSPIEVLLEKGTCSVYYSKPCRFFDTETHKCTIHEQPEQPSICVHYNPYTCFYKKVYDDRKQIRNGFIWLDRARLAYLAEQLRFDNDRNIVEAPDMRALADVFNRSFPYTPETSEPVGEPAVQTDIPYTSACAACGAVCCRSLLFYTEQPFNEGSVDFCTYATGFPGVTYLVADHRWAMLVEAHCRHLDEGNKCRIAGSDERPLRCRYLNPQQCSIRQDIHAPRQIRADYKTFRKIKEGIETDELGKVVSVKPVEELQKRL